MAGRIADLMVTISGDSSGLRKELNAVKRQIQSAFGSESLRLSEQIASKFKWVAAGAVALGAAAVKMSAEMDMVTRAFEVLTGSADRAKEHVEQLERFAATTPFEFPGLLEASKKLQAYGFQAEAVIPIMQTVGDAAMAVGLGQEGINRITLALGQMNAKGKVSAEEMRQLAETGLPAWDMLAQGIGVSVPQAMDLAKKGAIDATAGIGALLTGLDSKFNGMMDKMAGEIPQSFSNMQDSVKSIMRTLGADLTETFDLKTKMKGAADWLGDFASLAKTCGIREALEQMIPDSVRTAIVGISGAIVGIAVPAFALLAANVIAATWPILTIAGVVAVAAMAIYNNWGGMGTFWSVLWKGIVGIARWAWDAISYVCGKIASLVSWITDKVSSFMDVVRRVKTFALTGVMPEVEVKGEVKVETKEVDTAKKKVWSLKDAIDSLKPVGATGGAPKVGGGKTAKLSVPAIKTQQDSYDQLAEKAKSASDRIEDEWIRLTGTQLDALEKWYREETAALEESKSANENYERDVQRLKETYAEKRRKILSDEAREHARTMKRITDEYSRMYSQLETERLTGSAKGLFDIEDKARQDVKSVKDFFAEIAADYAEGTKKQKQDIIDALAETKAAYVVTGQDTLDFTNEIARYESERKKQLWDDEVSYFRQCEDIKADIEEAYNNNSLSRLRAVLNKENLMRLENLNAQKRIMDLYQETTIAAHITAAEQTANVLDDSRGSFKSFFSDILTGAKDFGDALKDLMTDLWQNIVDQMAEKWSAQIVEKLFGMASGGENSGGIFGGLFNMLGLGSLFSGESASGASFGTGEGQSGGVGGAVINGFTQLAGASQSLGGAMGVLGGAVQTGSTLMGAYNTIQSMLNVGTKPAETATTVTATTTLGLFTAAVASATAALEVMAAKSVFGGLFGFASGGYISGAGSGTSDSIPARLSNGEYVMKAEAVRRLGVSFLDKLNRGTLRGFASGGYVIPEFQTGPGRIDSAALSIPARLSNGEYVMKAEAVRRLGVSFLDRLNSGETHGFTSGGFVLPEFSAGHGRIDSSALSIPGKLLKALTGNEKRQEETAGGVVNIYGDINNNADERRLLRKLDATTRAALMGGY